MFVPGAATYSLFSSNWIPKTSVKYNTAMSDVFSPVMYRLTIDMLVISIFPLYRLRLRTPIKNLLLADRITVVPND